MKVGSSFHAHQSICIWILILTSCILGFPLFYFSVSAVAAAYTLFKVMFLSVLLEVALPFGLGSYLMHYIPWVKTKQSWNNTADLLLFLLLQVYALC